LFRVMRVIRGLALILLMMWSNAQLHQDNHETHETPLNKPRAPIRLRGIPLKAVR
jgi:hypothetical protein